MKWALEPADERAGDAVPARRQWCLRRTEESRAMPNWVMKMPVESVVDRTELLPFAFLLTIDAEDKPYGCEVRHHFGDRVGVAFVDVEIINTAMNSAKSSDTGSWIGPSKLPRLH